MWIVMKTKSFTCRKLLLFLILFQAGLLSAQQNPDTEYKIEITDPEYSPDNGPLIYLDEGHSNFHTLEGRYYTFGEILMKDGYRVEGLKDPITADILRGCKILVISNALHKDNETEWIEPVKPAFSGDEIRVIKEWVEEGGSLFLIADHMPFPKAVAELASAFGYQFFNCFAMDNRRRNLQIFDHQNGMLKSCALTRGRNNSESVDTVVSFTGQAFIPPGHAIKIIELNDDFTLLFPKEAWTFDNETPYISAMGFTHGAYSFHGKGRMVVMGEAAMFTAQKFDNGFKVGLNVPAARENMPFLLNIIHWLDRLY
jgi:hypothetical protein